MLKSILALGCLLVSCATAGATTFPINVHNAFLHLDPVDSNVGNALVIDLASLGLAPGNTIKLESVGDWNAGPGGDVQPLLLCVFSGSATLLDRSLLQRVPGAIDAGVHNYSGPTWPSGEPTDIPQDFAFGNPGASIVIPQGANYLFVTVADIYYADNSDPDGDCGVTVTLVSTTSVGPRDGLQDLRLVAGPNPFSNETALAFRLEQTVPTHLTIHDVSGRLVRTLIEGALDPGDHIARWDGRDEAGRRVPAGSYFARLQAGLGRQNTRVMRVD